MAISLKATAYNNADWNMQLQVTDADTGALLDFTGAAIEIAVKDANNCQKLLGTVDNGKITLPSTGIIEWLFPATDMQSLCAGQYKMGGVYQLNGETIALFTGELSVNDLVARL